MKISRKKLAGVSLVVGVSLLAVGEASATMPLQKKAKDAGFDVANCQYCHVDKLPKKDAADLNDRGKFLVAEKDKQKATEVDVTWLKNYVEKK